MTPEQAYGLLLKFFQTEHPGVSNYCDVREDGTVILDGEFKLRDLAEELAARFKRQGSLMPQDEAKLDARYADRQVPLFDTSEEGMENMALRCVKDYHAAKKPGDALSNAVSWIRRAVQHGRMEQREADLKAVGRYFDHQAQLLSDRMKVLR